MVIMGVVLNRLNVTITGTRGFSGEYFPSFFEISISIFMVVIAFICFALADKYLPVFQHEKAHEEKFFL